MKFEDASLHLATEITRAKRAIAIERAVPALLPATLLIGGWAAFALFGLQDRLAPLLATLGAILALAGAAALLARGLRGWKRATDQDARERLARDVNLDPHSFDSLEDRPARLDALGLALWEREQSRALEAAASLHAAPPRPPLRRADPLYLRFIAPVALVCALFVAGMQAPDRLARAFLPDPGPLLGDGPTEIEAWATPADYTGQAPVSLSDKIGKRIETAPRVEATVRVTGPVGAPYLVFDAQGGRPDRVKFKKAADGVWEARLSLSSPGTLRVERFHTKARWRILTGADAKPSARFVSRPKVVKDEVVFSWEAKDDYGVRDMALRIRPVDPPAGLKDAPARDVPIEAPTSDPKTANGEASLDLYDHPYAGLQVEVSLVARDAQGQEGKSRPARIKLPERIFLQPLAKAAIEIRRKILWERRAYAPVKPARGDDAPSLFYGNDILLGRQGEPVMTDEYDPRLERAPDAIRHAGQMIDALTAYPEDGYFQDTAVYLGLRGARAALDVASVIDDTDHAADILWQVAMRAEYGDSADARRALLEAQRALSQAIENGAGKEEIERLTEAVRQAMRNYMQALVAEARRNQDSQKNQEDTQERTQITGQDIQDLLDEIQRRAEAGDAEGAQQLLQQLQQLLENMEIQLGQQQGGGDGGGGQQGQNDQQLNDSVQGLSDAIGRQRGLRDETEREGREGAPNQRGQRGDELAQRQEQLRRDLDEVRRGAREAGPDEQDLGRAGDRMREAEERLRRGDLEGGERAQDEALRDMRAGADRLAQEMLRRDDQRNGRQNAKDDKRDGQQDPLGRQVGSGASGGDDVTVPEQVERERARDILDELRRRAQDPRRPEAERDYLRRLLERFSNF